jgi:hypothetical protein
MRVGFLPFFAGHPQLAGYGFGPDSSLSVGKGEIVIACFSAY